MNFEKEFLIKKEKIENYLKKALPDVKDGGELVFAMDYSLNAGGKRIRPVLTMGVCSALGGNEDEAVPFAAALEMIHTYSLIHDDLPCMDDDDLRRGRKTNHKVFGEAMALLAGDALLNYAFETVLKASFDSEKKLKILEVMSRNSGIFGMIGGQVLDIKGEGKKLGEEEIKMMHKMKTGALISSAVSIGAIVAGHSEDTFSLYASYLGLAFQLKDDILDRVSSKEVLGKDAGSDEEKEKSTLIEIYGLKECEKMLAETTEKAIESLSGKSEFLKELALYLLLRNK